MEVNEKIRGCTRSFILLGKEFNNSYLMCKDIYMDEKRELMKRLDMEKSLRRQEKDI
jgi:hypothetical protein